MLAIGQKPDAERSTDARSTAFARIPLQTKLLDKNPLQPILTTVLWTMVESAT